MNDFIDSATLAAWSKTPEWSGNELVDALVTVVSKWIRDHKPDVSDTDPAAQIVCFEVVRDALLYGEFGPATSFTKTVGHRTRSVVVDRSSVEKFITDRHKKMLGLSIGPRPAYVFGDR